MTAVLIPGNKRTLYFGTQSDKGTAQDTPTLAMRISDFTPNTVRPTTQLAETDRLTQESADAVIAVQPGFSFKAYLRPSEAAFFFQGVLGSDSDSPGPTNFVHTITPDEATPYITCFEEEPDVLCNKYVDCRVTQIDAAGSNGGVCEATITVEALSFEAGATAPTTPDPADEEPYVYPESSTTKGSDPAGIVDQWQLTINRNATRAGGDVGFGSFDIVNGKFAVSGQITKFMQDDADQRLVDTGDAAGTTPTTIIGTEALTITLTRDANTGIEFAMAAVSYPTLTRPVNTDGQPIAEVISFRTVPADTLADNMTVTVKDQKATPDS